MERLSDNAIEIVNELHTEKLTYESEYVPIIDALNRLAEYEDIGLEPEKIVFLSEPSDCDWMAFIDKEPAADVAPIVRCKDCRLRGREECAMFYRCECGEQHTWETDNDFCSYGEKL